MKNKKSIMFFSSLLILIFHLWINIFDRTSNLYNIEEFIRQMCFIGVDIFFFLSAYSIANIKKEDYKSFIKSRLKKVYIPYIIFALIALFYTKWNFKTFILNILGINLFLQGGGSFLWFIPTVMLVYLVLPLYKEIDNKYKIITPLLTSIILLILTIILSLLSQFNHIFIITNRIPIILIGYYFKKTNIIDKLSKKYYIVLSLILTIIGLIILYNFRYLNLSYIKDVFYILGIPLIIGIILLINLIPTNKIINILGSITFEMYAIQMIFGYKITEYLLLKSSHLLTNLLSITVVILLSLIIHYIFNKILFFNKKALAQKTS